MYSAIFVRAFQIRAIYNMAKSSKVLISKQNKLRGLIQLVTTFGIMVVIQIIVLLLWSTIDTWQPSQNQIDSLRRTFTYICSSNTNWVWFGLEIAYFCGLLAFGLYVVYRTWDMKHLVLESKWIAISIYNSIVIIGIVVALFTTDTPTDDSVFFIGVSAIGFLSLTTMVALYLPKVIRSGLADASMTNSKTTNTLSIDRKNGTASKSSSKDNSNNL